MVEELLGDGRQHLDEGEEAHEAEEVEQGEAHAQGVGEPDQECHMEQQVADDEGEDPPGVFHTCHATRLTGSSNEGKPLRGRPDMRVFD